MLNFDQVAFHELITAA